MKYALSILVAGMLLLSCENQNSNDSISKNNLASKVDYGDKIVTKTIFESHYKMILFALKKGQDLKPHSAPMDAPLVMLTGRAKVIIGDQETTLKQGDILTLPKDIDHAVYPITDCKFLLMK